MKYVTKYLYDLPLIRDESLLKKLERKKKFKKFKIENENNNIMIKKNEIKLSDCPLDELFMWSIFIYSGKEQDMDLIKYYWSLTTKPVGCALAAIIVYDRFMQKSFISSDFKEQLKRAKKFVHIFNYIKYLKGLKKLKFLFL